MGLCKTSSEQKQPGMGSVYSSHTWVCMHLLVCKKEFWKAAQPWQSQGGDTQA